MANDTQTYEYKAEMKQLLHLIVHSLYTHPEIFLRELVSNSSDALNKIRYRQLTDQNILDKDKELKINITVDSKKKTFSIEETSPFDWKDGDDVIDEFSLDKEFIIPILKNIDKHFEKYNERLIRCGVLENGEYDDTEEVSSMEKIEKIKT